MGLQKDQLLEDRIFRFGNRYGIEMFTMMARPYATET
jgi:hypothetical protein